MDLFITLWIAFAVLTGVAATGKNRGFLPWLCVGALFGVFGLIAVLVMKPEVEGHRGI